MYLEVKNSEYNWEFCHSLTDFIYDTDGCFSESHGAHLFFIVKKLGNRAQTWFHHPRMTCNHQLFNNCEEALTCSLVIFAWQELI